MHGRWRVRTGAYSSCQPVSQSMTPKNCVCTSLEGGTGQSTRVVHCTAAAVPHRTAARRRLVKGPTTFVPGPLESIKSHVSPITLSKSQFVKLQARAGSPRPPAFNGYLLLELTLLPVLILWN